MCAAARIAFDTVGIAWQGLEIFMTARTSDGKVLPSETALPLQAALALKTALPSETALPLQTALALETALLLEAALSSETALPLQMALASEPALAAVAAPQWLCSTTTDPRTALRSLGRAGCSDS